MALVRDHRYPLPELDGRVSDIWINDRLQLRSLDFILVMLIVYLFIVAVALSILPHAWTHHYRGFDTTEACNVTCMRCMAKHHKFFIGRLYARNNGFDEVGLQNIKNAMTTEMGKLF